MLDLLIPVSINNHGCDMTATSVTDLHVKPRVLIADDSRIVRATLIKHIEGMFEFREAHDGMQAWETLLVDPSIRVLITDLTMPKLDGYGLLQRIRTSSIPRIRDMLVIVVSGSDEQEERNRVKAAGATDLITKGIDTAQLLSRLDVLTQLVPTQDEFQRNLEVLARSKPSPIPRHLDTPENLHLLAEVLLATAIRNKRNFAVLCLRIGLKRAHHLSAPPSELVKVIGNLLLHTVRQTDRVALTGEAEFLLATGSIDFDSVRIFAQRICQAIANANLMMDKDASLVASCGTVSLAERDASFKSIDTICETARRRAAQGLQGMMTGVVGAEEEQAFR